ncbi:MULTISPECIES: DUF4064 domain-containing protein [Bacillaceae]|uniref:DUF4064 domain-containing protein n=1 Tax=Bacillaceae TaxID=186817 RepID=UPI000C7667F7|nr:MULTISPECIES: DUF4064 domain-containing protein [Bacillaceae]PLR65850.1 hypothetical protein CYJ36_21605 [Bacillus sp. UMB0893]
MNRKLERRLVLIGAAWEIITGLITIFFYASLIKKQGLDVKETSLVKIEAVQSLFGSLYMFAVTFGMLFIAMGLINIYLARHLEDNRVEVKKPFWFLLIGLASYLMMDIVGSLMFLSAGILSLAKNKTIAKMEEYNEGFS